MAVKAEDLKEYLRLPPDCRENLDLFLNAAKGKAKAAGVPDYIDNAQYDLFLLALSSMLYDNRGFSFSGVYQQAAEENARKLINGFVLELRYTGEAGDALE